MNNKDMSNSIYDVIIIGAGPAGLTAALYAQRAGLKTLVLEDTTLISQMAYAYLIENFPAFPEGIGGIELTDKIRKQAEKFGATIIADPVNSISALKHKTANLWHIKAAVNTYDCLSVIIASGARRKRLEVGGEERLRGRGVAYCATCDGPLFRDKDIAVVGGGNSALEEALFLTKFAKKVIIIHRKDRLRAAKALQEKASSNEKIEIVLNSVVEEIIGKEMVEGVRIKDVSSYKEKLIPCQGVFVSIGFTPNTDFASDVVKLDENGCIVVDNITGTSVGGIFACGDCSSAFLKQIVTACGDGARAAFSCQQYVEALKGASYK